MDTAGQCSIIDFGLAGVRGDDENRQEASPDTAGHVGPLTAIGGVMGTAQYMSPEQYDGRADARSDVWGLGCTLYELLTLRRAFDGETGQEVRDKISHREPVSLEQLVRGVPRDLAAICRKTLRMKAEDRYQSAGDVADDLRRWLRHEPTMVRGAWVGRRLLLWGRRNPGWAAAILLAVLTVLAVTQMSIYAAQKEKEVAQKAKENAENEANAAKEREREREYDLSLQQLQRIRTTPQRNAWRDEAWGLVRKAADIRRDSNLRNQAAATLVGLDVREEKRFKSFSTSSLAFDPKGERLLIGAGPNRDGRWEGAKVWDVKKQDLSEPSGQSLPGPVAFRPNGAPVQLMPKDAQTLQLWHVATGEKLQEVQFSADARKAGMVLARGPVGLPLIALSADGSLIAASANNGKPDRPIKETRGLTVLWDAVSGKQLLEVPQVATALAFAPSGTLLATGDWDGSIAPWSLPEGKSVANFRLTRLPADTLAFSPDAGAGGDGRLRGRLAVGGAGGEPAVWDLKDKLPRSFCRGSAWDVYAAAFSPDGTLLASGGRDAVHLWDATTGSLLITCPDADFVTSLTFSPDGGSLVAGRPTLASKRNGEVNGEVVIRRLEDGRGIRTLRGLTQRVIFVSPSQDGRRLAALAHNWEVGVWELPRGQLRQVFQVPPGLTADNPGLALSRDGRRLAFASGSAAKLCDVDSGKEIRTWELPRGLVDRLAYDRDGRLLLFRLEAEEGKPVCQVRNLLGAEPLKPIAQVRDFNFRVLDAVLTADGSRLAAIGLSGPGGKERWVRVYEAASGKELWSEKMPEACDWSEVTTDPEGKLLVFPPGTDGDRGVLVEMATGKRADTLAYFPRGLSPRAKYAVRREKDALIGAEVPSLYRGKDGSRLVSFATDVPSSSARVEFNGDGTCFASAGTGTCLRGS